MASTRDFKKQVGRNADQAYVGSRVLACGHTTDAEPELAAPNRWWCCGAFQKAKK